MRAISRLPNIVGAKAGEAPLLLLAEYRAVVPEDFIIYTGADADVVRVTEHGAQGVVSGVSSVLPAPFRAAVEGRGTPQELQRGVDQAVSAIAGDMARMHEAYALQG